MSERWHGSARARNQEQRENISHCWRYSCLDSTSLQDERSMSRDSLQWIFMAGYASYALAANRHRQTWIWWYMRLRAMILDTFASKNRSKCIPKALWGRLWSRLGPPWVKTSKTHQQNNFPRVTFGVHFEPFLSPGVHPGLPVSENVLLLFATIFWHDF